MQIDYKYTNTIQLGICKQIVYRYANTNQWLFTSMLTLMIVINYI